MAIGDLSRRVEAAGLASGLTCHQRKARRAWWTAVALQQHRPKQRPKGVNLAWRAATTRPRAAEQGPRAIADRRASGGDRSVEGASVTIEDFAARCQPAALDVEDRTRRYVSSWRDWDVAGPTLYPFLFKSIAGRFPWETER